MPVRLPGRRVVGKGGALKPLEKARIAEWFIAGNNVVQVYAECLDNGIDPPHNETLYRILNSAEVQDGLRTRLTKERKKSISSIVRRTTSRNALLEKIEKTVEARGEHYAGFVPGGEQGLVVLSDRKTVKTGADDYDTVDIYKTDTGIIAAWDTVLNSQEKSDQALRKNLRDDREHVVNLEAAEVNVAAGEIGLRIATHELNSWEESAAAPPPEVAPSDSDSGASEGDTGETGAPFAIQYTEQDRA
jgi:hypothetical protein